MLNRWARVSRDAEAYGSGDPKKIGRRLRNRFKGRLLAKFLNSIEFWR
jgi:hypothetical protein